MSNRLNSETLATLYGILLAVILVAIVLVTGKVLLVDLPLTLSEIVGVLTLAVISAALVVAIWVQIRKEQFDRSLAYLESATELIEKARRVLINEDGSVSNNRVNWVTAARLITRCEMIVNNIEVDAHRKIFDSAHDFYRHDFGETLRKDQAFQKAAFFLGVEDVNRSIGQAACDQNEPEDTRSWIPAQIIATVIRFTLYPENYEDPLSNSRKLSTQELEKLWINDYKSLISYLQFRDRFYKVGGRVNGKSSHGAFLKDVQAAQIDSELRASEGMFYDQC